MWSGRSWGDVDSEGAKVRFRRIRYVPYPYSSSSNYGVTEYITTFAPSRVRDKYKRTLLPLIMGILPGSQRRLTSLSCILLVNC